MSTDASELTVLDTDHREMFHAFCHAACDRIAPNYEVPDTVEEWEAHRTALRAKLWAALGAFPDHKPPLKPQIMGREEFQDYFLEKIVLESRPGLFVTTNLYVPKNADLPAPGVLSLHGHTPRGKLDPKVQTRNIGMAKCGFVVLCVDTIGASERHYRGERYHGRQLGAQAFPSGLTLNGLHVWDNMYALDYLCSRPEVDASRIGCTGASGGCNQTVYMSALDERIQVAAPVCCVGSYRGYLNGPHCVCEMIPGVLSFAEMGDTLSLVAPRALMLINGVHDGGGGFQIDDMRQQFAKLEQVYELLGARDKLAKHEADAGHGYIRVMREAMYAWFRKQLLGIQADVYPESDIEPAPEDRIACFRGGDMPEPHETVPSLAFAEGRRVAAGRLGTLAHIERDCFGGFPDCAPKVTDRGDADADPGRKLVVETEPGIVAPIVVAGQGADALLWLHPEGKAAALATDSARAALGAGMAVAAADLRGIGETLWPDAAKVQVWDYQYFQNGIKLGRPMLGMWTWDALQCLRALRERFERVRVAGQGVCALVALLAAGFDKDVAGVECRGLLSSWLWPERFADAFPMSTFVPGMLKYADVSDLASFVAPRPLEIVGAVDGGASALSQADAEAAFANAREAYGPHAAKLIIRS